VTLVTEVAVFWSPHGLKAARVPAPYTEFHRPATPGGIPSGFRAWGWDILGGARPHPDPLPRGEGEQRRRSGNSVRFPWWCRACGLRSRPDPELNASGSTRDGRAVPPLLGERAGVRACHPETVQTPDLPVGIADRCKEQAGPPHSRTLRSSSWPCVSRSVLERGGPAPLFPVRLMQVIRDSAHAREFRKPQESTA